jgi:bacillithiol system protein YtxJ
VKLRYTEIVHVAEWYSAWTKSIHRPLLLLKHSTACPISAAALGEFIIFTRKPKRTIDMYLVKVIESRLVSNQIAESTGIIHQSPQIMIMHNQQVLWQVTHWDITYERIEHEVNSRI